MEKSSAISRLQLLESQLCNSPQQLAQSDLPKKTLQQYRQKSTVSPLALRETIFGQHYAIRERIFKIIANDPLFRHFTSLDLDRKQHRYLSFKQFKRLVDEFHFGFDDLKSDPSLLLAVSDAMSCFDNSVAIKMAVHLHLYMKTLINLGTAKHRHFVENAISITDFGCFALTELGHGSNVRDIKTTAHYDPTKREFIINTPDDLAMKFWIGAAAHLANMATVFAQLYVKDKCYGVHAFIVPIRNKVDHSPIPGIVVGDCGQKLGLNGLDNGFIIFKNVRVPYDNMLDRFSQVKENEKFTSTISNDNKRFGISLGSLSNGRINLIIFCNGILRNAITIGIRFATVRRQFGPENSPETPIIEYPLVQYRLMEYLAGSYAFSFVGQSMQSMWENSQEFIFDEKSLLLNEMHALSSALKPVVSWFVQRGIQEVREVCGGLGYSAYNRLGAFRDDNDVNLTWEGDNNVLIQQTSKFLLDSLRKLIEGQSLPYPSLEFLKPFHDSESKWPPANEDEILANDYIKKALEHRANYNVHMSFLQVQENVSKFDTPTEAWNGTQVFYLQNAAKSYAELHIINEFLKGVKRCSDKNSKKSAKINV
jgi:acyl-CoA oxidase